MVKVLYFEGAGWPEADGCEEVGNCRIRTAFTRTDGRKVYLELRRGIRNKCQSKDIPEHYVHIDYAHYITDDPKIDDCNSCRMQLDGKALPLPWSKAAILHVATALCGGEFDAVEVLNDLTGYRVFADGRTRTSADYNFGDVFQYDADLTARALTKRDELRAENKAKFGMKYDNTSYWLDGGKLHMRLNVSKKALDAAGITERDYLFDV